MAVALHGAGATGRLNIDIAEDNTCVDADRGHVGNMDGMLVPAEPVWRVMNDRGGRDLDLRWKQMIAGAKAACPKHVPGRERPPFSPDDEREHERGRHRGERCNNPGRPKVELSHEGVMLS